MGAAIQRLGFDAAGRSTWTTEIEVDDGRAAAAMLRELGFTRAPNGEWHKETRRDLLVMRVSR